VLIKDGGLPYQEGVYGARLIGKPGDPAVAFAPGLADAPRRPKSRNRYAKRPLPCVGPTTHDDRMAHDATVDSAADTVSRSRVARRYLPPWWVGLLISIAGAVSQCVLLIVQRHWSALAAVTITHLPTLLAPAIVWRTYRRDANGNLWPRFGDTEERKILELWIKVITVSTVGALLGVLVTTAHLPVATSGVEFWIATVVGVTLWTLLVEIALIPLLADEIATPA
jgi:hypothetical protein